MNPVLTAIIGMACGLLALLRGGPAQTLILSVSVHISSYRARGACFGAAIATAVHASAAGIFQSMLIGMGTSYNVIQVLIAPAFVIQGVIGLGYSKLPKNINQSPGATDSVGMGFIKGMYDLTQFIFWVLVFTVLDAAKLIPSDVVGRIIIALTAAVFYFVFLHIINPIAAKKELNGTKNMMLLLQRVSSIVQVVIGLVMAFILFRDI